YRIDFGFLENNKFFLEYSKESARMKIALTNQKNTLELPLILDAFEASLGHLGEGEIKTNFKSWPRPTGNDRGEFCTNLIMRFSNLRMAYLFEKIMLANNHRDDQESSLRVDYNSEEKAIYFLDHPYDY